MLFACEHVASLCEVSPIVTVSMAEPDKEKEDTEMETRLRGVVTSAEGDEESGQESKDSLVEVYADRLCAVTHALALCCSSMQKAIKK